MYKIRSFKTFREDDWNKIVIKLDGDFNYTSHFLNYQNILLENNKIKNSSFVVYDEIGEIVCLSVVIIEVFNSKIQISRGGETIPFPLLDKKLTEQKKTHILNFVFKYLDEIVKSNDVQNIRIRTPISLEKAEIKFYMHFLENICFKLLKTNLDWLTLKSESIAVINLNNNNLKFRSSYKNLIKKSEEKCELSIITKENFNNDDFFLYTKFHNENKIIKRSEKIFMENQRLIMSNMQLIFICKYQNKILGSITVNHFNKIAFYQSSVNKKLLSNYVYPNHFLLKKSIEYLKQKKINFFVLGEVISKIDEKKIFTDKEKNVSFFKMGWNPDIFTSKKYEKNIN